MNPVIRDIRVKELLYMLAKINASYDLIDIVFDVARNGLIINPISQKKPLIKEEKIEKRIDEIAPDTDLTSLLGE